MAYSARILADSLPIHRWPNRNEVGQRLTTIEVTFPRIVLAEFNTHRMFSRNSASSRAIPVKKMLDRVENDPFIPVYWGKNQSGMQAAEELSSEAKALALQQWLRARDNAVTTVKRLQLPDIDLHKQIANRLLEPFLWHTVICTATEWENFWGLRCNKDAQPEIRIAAEMMRVAYDASTPVKLLEEDWHMPLVSWEEITTEAAKDELDLSRVTTSTYKKTMDFWKKISVGRCARVSYLTHDGKRDLQADIDLCDRLQKSGHMSPFEHVARPMTVLECEEKYGLKGKYVGDNIDPSKNFAGNFRGWVQFRKELPSEDNFLKRGS